MSAYWLLVKEQKERATERLRQKDQPLKRDFTSAEKQKLSGKDEREFGHNDAEADNATAHPCDTSQTEGDTGE